MPAAVNALEQPLELELFEGPFDLLLTLVLREEIDLMELPVALLVGEALGTGDLLWDAATAGELIVLIAATAELKARVMLGEEIEEEPDEDTLEARERLAARVIAYAPFQRAAEWLRECGEDGKRHHYRRAPIADAPPSVEQGDIAQLGELIQGLMIARPQPSLAHLAVHRVQLPEVLLRLETALATTRRISFEGMLNDGGPLEEGMTLLAALELARRGHARLEQPEAFGDITIVAAS